MMSNSEEESVERSEESPSSLEVEGRGPEENWLEELIPELGRRRPARRIIIREMSLTESENEEEGEGEDYEWETESEGSDKDEELDVERI
jgi:hypothetical protein